MPDDPNAVPPFHGDISFNAQHSPVGAFMSFTCGHFGTRGGFGLQIGKPGDQDLYIGVKDGDRFSDAPLKVLPFYQGAASDEASRYDVDRQSGPAEQAEHRAKVVPYAKDQIRRHYGWATDHWATDDFEFAIYTPFAPIPDPDASGITWTMPELLPAVVAELTVDNTAGTTPKTAFFAMSFAEKGVRLLGSREGAYSGGFALGGRLGVAAYSDATDDRNVVTAGGDVFTFCRWTVNEGLTHAAAHLLGSTPGVGLTVAPGHRRTLQLVFGAYLAGTVTTGLQGRYGYTRCFTCLEHVLEEAGLRFDAQRSNAELLDHELLASGLSPDQQFLVAHATRSYHGSTQLLDVGGRPAWVVNEGEYCMMNTLDLSVDQCFWELDRNPWVVRNVLDQFVTRYSYVDEVKVPDGAGGHDLKPGGLSFCHDMGVHNNFSPVGHSSYELPDLTGCFSYMTAEQLCNWVLIAACYVAKTGEDDWLRLREGTIRACMVSLLNRCGDSGYIEYDAARCGPGGAEITTYDSLDPSLAQTRSNLYIAVKCWATYLGLAFLLGDRIGNAPAGEAMRAAAAKIVASLAADPHHRERGFIPAVMEPGSPGYESRILPAAEGLIYPLFIVGCGHGVGVGTDGDLAALLNSHTETLLNDPERRNLFPDGGIRLSSTSDNSWMSKIALFQHVAREVFHLDDDPAVAQLFADADAAHVRWQTEGESAYWAMSDQMVNGVAMGSRYYPRCVTTALWMSGRSARRSS